MPDLIPPGTQAGGTPSTPTEVISTSSGKTDGQTSTAGSSQPSRKHRKPAKKSTRKPRQVASKVTVESRLSIAQSALARLADAGVEVFVREEDGKLIVTIMGVGMDDKKFVLQ